MAGVPGAVHDASIWNDSTVLKKIRRNEILNEEPLIINGRSVKPFLLGDAAYPVRTFMVCPYK